jgi:hypothetical protein
MTFERLMRDPHQLIVGDGHFQPRALSIRANGSIEMAPSMW